MNKIIKKIILLQTMMTIGMSQNPLIIPPAMTGNNFDLTLQVCEMEFFPGV